MDYSPVLHNSSTEDEGRSDLDRATDKLIDSDA